ncbi:S8 family serine peptidase [Streptomyces sp. CC210A]|uniref:S8 family serine peptidase n=1 Tax=Streptomyces sp. CC210A TaxID=2898184 RepID=UPI001F193EB0|nr:S8 family serine peptidase [Streptomyces sp. CC210A]
MFHLARARGSHAIGLLGILIAVLAATLAVAFLAPIARADDVRARQWYLDAMKAEDLWKVATGKGITVAVVDSGVDSTVPELRGKVLPGWNFYDAGGGLGRVDERDTDRHGTNMATTIAGTGAGGGLKGLAPGATILPVYVGPYISFGFKPVADGVRYAVDEGARIINLSFVGTPSPSEAQYWQDAVDYARSKGALLFAGTGNTGTATANYPAASPGVVAVGAVGTTGKVSKFSNYGDHVALAAPGEKIPARCVEDKTHYCQSGGTSHATAIASAAAALIWSAHPDWTANQVLRVMMETAGASGPVPSIYIGYGAVRPSQVLLEGKGDPGPADVDPLQEARKKNPPVGGADASPSGSPAPEDTAPGAGDEPAAESPQAAAPDTGAEPGKSGSPLWATVASVAAVAVVVVVGVAIVLSVRRRKA